MMDAIAQYLLRIVAAAMICGIAAGLVEKKGTTCVVMKLLTGIFMALTVIGPWANIRLDQLPKLSDAFQQEAAQYRLQGETEAKQALQTGIKQSAEAYILDKAAALGIRVSVEVVLADGDLPVPEQVLIKGAVSPYAKQKLTRILSEDLGIAEEDQKWR